jgi:hypothetical protein
MSAAPEHLRAARIAIPRLPLPAILFFAVLGLGGSLFLTYTSSFPAAEPIKAAGSPAVSAPVYAVPAVPFDAQPDNVAAQAIASTQAGKVPSSAPRSTETADFASDSPSSSEPVLFGEATSKFKGFNRFSEFGAAQNLATLTATTFGMSSQTNAPGYVAPDAEAISAPVPEPSTWFCGVALLALLLTRGLHASWHRHQRRTAHKTNSTRS